MDDPTVTPKQLTRSAVLDAKSEFFHREFKGESDRASAILAAAMLDEALTRLLQKRLVRIKGKKDPLFEANGALSSFSSRIELGYRMGLYERLLAQSLHLVRAIRNDFAHNVEGCTFTDSAVIDRIGALWSGLHMEGIPVATGETAPRRRFELAAGWMLWWLWCIVDEATSIREIPATTWFDKPAPG